MRCYKPVFAECLLEIRKLRSSTVRCMRHCIRNLSDAYFFQCSSIGNIFSVTIVTFGTFLDAKFTD
jgi:hypothetical protein